ncbi:MAG: dihydrofolate reductase [Candidatus Vogelbacteria bacterium]
MSFSIIVAQARNGVIGEKNELPWRLSGDLKRFKALTLGHPVVMGRKTYESILARIGKPLLDRENIILTRQKDFSAPGCLVINNLSEIEMKARDQEIFIIGGEEVYRLALPKTDKIYLTLIEAEVDGDAYFPKLEEMEWKLIREEKYPADEKNDYDSTFRIYERKK